MFSEWNSVHALTLAEKDFTKQWELRHTIVSIVDCFLTSMSAIAEGGELAYADLSGFRIVMDEGEAQQCIDGFVLAVEDARARDAYGAAASDIAHYAVIRKANPYFLGRIQVVLMYDALGF
ncbi:hypothetical protein BGX27_003746 [Mortierella sp. AM989]|nr:hypothetical protein BGX27_003746 [Mortierella sp. AM989]